jgi:hypothetical protein
MKKNKVIKVHISRVPTENQGKKNHSLLYKDFVEAVFTLGTIPRQGFVGIGRKNFGSKFGRGSLYKLQRKTIKNDHHEKI